MTRAARANDVNQMMLFDLKKATKKEVEEDEKEVQKQSRTNGNRSSALSLVSLDGSAKQ